MTLEDKCKNKKEISRLIHYNLFSHHKRIEGKIEFLKHLRENPVYACYFCDGYNYNCGEYDTSNG